MKTWDLVAKESKRASVEVEEGAEGFFDRAGAGTATPGSVSRSG